MDIWKDEGGYKKPTASSGPRVQCFKCKDIIQSMHRHDFKWCECRSVAIDGGGDYTKMSYEPTAIWFFLKEED